ncbi:unnamed protein product [Somion occarium]|uniref:Histone deacetylase interacting domain-containing protein n=1 Tax=Somion occarium TaxID=3059160 RepID=A0ABP1CHC5_9APHY
METPRMEKAPPLSPSAQVDDVGQLPQEPLTGPSVTHPPEDQPGSSASRPRSPQPRYQISQPHLTSSGSQQLMLDPTLVDHSPNPVSRPRTPLAKPQLEGKPLSSPNGSLIGVGEPSHLFGPEGSRPPGERQLNVTDALSYLDAVKLQFQDKPDVYNHFLDIMKDFKGQQIDTPGVIERVSMLFQGNPNLIQGFNTFLPPGYKIELSTDPRNLNGITVTTPAGVVSQPNHLMGGPMRLPRDSAQPGLLPAFPPQPPFGPPPVLPVGVGQGSRPASPMMHPIPHHMPGYVDETSPYLPGEQEAAVNLNGGRNSPMEFNHAIQFLNKIKVRYVDEPDTYKQFLEILQNFQKEQRPLLDSQVFPQVQMLFKNAPDLMEEFRAFLPDLGDSQATLGFPGILPHAIASTSNWHQNAESPSLSAEKPKAASRRRKRIAEKEPAVLQKTAGGRASKKAKTNHKPEPASPQFAYEHLPSPQPSHLHAHQATLLSRHQQYTAHLNGTHALSLPNGSSPQGELAFFDRVKKTLENGGTYEEFLKLLNLYARDVIDVDTLIERADIFLDTDLMRQFKELMGWEERFSTIENGPPGSLRTSAPDMSAPPPDDGLGPSYRKLPASEVRLACSGRDELARSVLNDEWVSHPTWASEESGFVAHRKSNFEETLHRCEEERHDFQVHIDGLYRTIVVLDPLDARLEEMSPEERSSFRLKPDLGGSCKAIYSRTMRRIYGRDAGMEVMRGLQECPSVAIPVVLSRLKQKYEEVLRLRREWNRTWKEIDCKNFYKALDHQGITFKQNDKKNITTKSFVQEIDNARKEHKKLRDMKGGTFYGTLGPHLQYDFKHTDVLHDALKMIYTFLDHSHSQYSPSERRSVERFLRNFVPVLFTFSHQEFDAACGPTEFDHEDADNTDQRGGRRSVSGSRSTGVAPGDLRKRLLKTVQDNSPRRKKGKDSPLRSADSASPAAPRSPAVISKNLEDPESTNLHSNPEDFWIREFLGSPEEGRVSAGETPVSSRPFYANTTFYTLLRLLQLLYSRLQVCKEIGARHAREKHASLKPNPIAVQLGLEDPSGPGVVLAQAIEAVGNVGVSGEEPNVLYMYLLDACEKVFENELDQATFEEHMRWFFGTKAHQVFTLDKVITAIIKQVQTITADNKCQELWDLLQKARRGEMATIHEIVRYRREAERNAGSDEHLYKVDWDMRSRTLRIQLLGADDPSIEEDSSRLGRWRQYVGTYVTQYPTELLPQGRASRAKAEKSRLFLKRSLIDGDGADQEDVQEASSMGVSISLSTYRLQYEAGTEDVLWRVRRSEEEELFARAQARSAERIRSRWLK